MITPGSVLHVPADVIPGKRSRYECVTICDVLRHLRNLRAWIDGEERRLQRSRPQFVARARHMYKHDTDILLNALVMLTALGALDDDCERFATTRAALPVLPERV
jgi:hypothetical protein